MKHLAVIDLGSNSARLTVTRIQDNGAYENVVEKKDPVRLSENMGKENILKQPAIDRTIESLKAFHDIYAQYENVEVKAVATAATRIAKNQKEFINLVKNETGINLEVISGETEARYDYLGVMAKMPVANCIIMDTGGASTELILVHNHIAEHMISIPYGAVNLTETFLDADKVSAYELFCLTSKMQNIFNNIMWLNKGRHLPIVALGGSNRTLAKIIRKKVLKQAEVDIQSLRMSLSEAQTIYENLLQCDLKQRRAIPGVSKERADIIIGGLNPIITIMNLIDSQSIMFSTAGLRNGILSEYLSNNLN